MSSSVNIEALVRASRRDLVAASDVIRGVESVDAAAVPGDLNRYRIEVRFVPSAPNNSKAPVPPGLRPANFRITGPRGGLVVERLEYDQARPSAIFLHVRGGAAGPEPVLLNPRYMLSIAGLPDIDPFLSSIAFIPETGGSRREDCLPAPAPASAPSEGAFVDYLNKDYSGFRRLVLDSFTLWDAAWRERNEADTGMVLAEILAYAGDYLSYHQDAAATEAYLGTARLRTSVRRHAVLLDYRLHEGCNSRLWVAFQVSGQIELAAGTRLLSTMRDRSGQQETSAAQESTPRVFETMHDARLYQDQNQIDFYTWRAEKYRIPRGATSALLLGHFPHLSAGDALIFEEVVFTKDGRCEPYEHAVPGRRHVVRLSGPPRPGEDSLGQRPVTEVFWNSEDAVPFEMDVHIQDSASGNSSEDPIPTFIVRGNVVLADFGATQNEYPLPPVPQGQTYRPSIATRGLTCAVPWSRVGKKSARETMLQDPRQALPSIRLYESTPRGRSLTWLPRHDLLESSPFDRAFVVEVDDNGQPFLRFGDGRQGRRPAVGASFTAIFRTGNGPFGSIGPESITGMQHRDARVLSLRNPLAASAAALPETIEHARLTAPVAYGTQNRCITPGDYRDIACRYPEVADAAVERKWTGSWLTDFIYIQRTDGLPADRPFLRKAGRWLEGYRILGRYIYLKPPVFVPLDILLAIRIEAGADWPSVYRALRKAFSTSGFFAPSRYHFGTPVYLSEIIAAVMAIKGVVSATPTLFERWGRSHHSGLDSGVIQPGPVEVIRVENDPSVPEHGQIDFSLQVGA